jgi:hypothetical protein
MEAGRNLEEKLIETPTAKEAVLYANTPGYLYDRLKKDTSVSYVAHELSTEDILRKLEAVSHKAQESALALVQTYVFLTALSLKDDLLQHRSQFEALDLKRVEWAEQIRQLILHESIPTGFSRIVYHSTDKIVTSTSSGQSSGIVIVPGKDYQ